MTTAGPTPPSWPTAALLGVDRRAGLRWCPGDRGHGAGHRVDRPGRRGGRPRQPVRVPGQAATDAPRAWWASTATRVRPRSRSSRTTRPTRVLVAADLVAQAEHDELATCLLITTSPDLVPRVEAALADEVAAHAPRRTGRGRAGRPGHGHRGCRHRRRGPRRRAVRSRTPRGPHPRCRSGGCAHPVRGHDLHRAVDAGVAGRLRLGSQPHPADVGDRPLHRWAVHLQLHGPRQLGGLRRRVAGRTRPDRDGAVGGRGPARPRSRRRGPDGADREAPHLRLVTAADPARRRRARQCGAP